MNTLTYINYKDKRHVDRNSIPDRRLNSAFPERKKETFAKAMLFQYALWLYRTQKLSLGKVAELIAMATVADAVDMIKIIRL